MAIQPTRVKLISPPVTTAITLQEAKDHLRVVDTDTDALIAALLTAATGHAEAFLGRALVDQTWELYLDSFPTQTSTTQNCFATTQSSFEILIPKPPLIAVTQIAYDNSSGDEQIIASGNYYVDTVSEPGWVVPQGGFTWPTPIDAINSVRVRFRAGYQDTNSPPNPQVPEDIKAAVKLILGSLFEQRESQVVGTIANPLPWGAEQLMRQHRVLLGMA